MSFRSLRIGDVVTRELCDTLMTMEVVEVKEDVLVCAAVGKSGEIECWGGWMFDRNTGVEEDPDLGWGVSFGRTGSKLRKLP